MDLPHPAGLESVSVRELTRSSFEPAAVHMLDVSLGTCTRCCGPILSMLTPPSPTVLLAGNQDGGVCSGTVRGVESGLSSWAQQTI